MATTTMPLQSEKPVSKTFTFDPTRRAFLSLGCFSWTLPLGWLSFGFNVIAVDIWFVTSYDRFEQIWIIVERLQHLLNEVHATLFFLKFRNFETVCGALRLMPQILLDMSRTIYNFSNSDLIYSLLQCFHPRPTSISIVIYTFFSFLKPVIL